MSVSNTRILQPRGARVRFITVEQWHLDICNQHQPAAAVLAYLVSYHNQRQADKERAAMINEELKRKGRLPSWNQTDWQFHTDKQLERGIMLFKVDAIRGGIRHLEANELVDTEPPAELKEVFTTGRTKWFLVNFDKINDWILENFDGADTDVAPEPPPLSDGTTGTEKPKSETAKQAAGMTAQARRVFKYWQAKTGNESMPPDRAQLNVIMNRLKNGLTEFHIAHAIIGNTLDQFYIDRNLHGLSTICKGNDKIAGFIKTAEKAGINPTQARYEYESIVGAVGGGSSQPQATPAAKADVLVHYKRAAKQIVQFVRVDKMPAKEVVRIFKFQEFDFKTAYLTNAAELADQMIAILSGDEIVDEAKRQRTLKYAQNLIEGLRK